MLRIWRLVVSLYICNFILCVANDNGINITPPVLVLPGENLTTYTLICSNKENGFDSCTWTSIKLNLTYNSVRDTVNIRRDNRNCYLTLEINEEERIQDWKCTLENFYGTSSSQKTWIVILEYGTPPFQADLHTTFFNRSPIDGKLMPGFTIVHLSLTWPVPNLQFQCCLKTNCSKVVNKTQDLETFPKDGKETSKFELQMTINPEELASNQVSCTCQGFDRNKTKSAGKLTTVAQIKPFLYQVTPTNISIVSNPTVEEVIVDSNEILQGTIQENGAMTIFSWKCAPGKEHELKANGINLTFSCPKTTTTTTTTTLNATSGWSSTTDMMTIMTSPTDFTETLNITSKGEEEAKKSKLNVIFLTIIIVCLVVSLSSFLRYHLRGNHCFAGSVTKVFKIIRIAKSEHRELLEPLRPDFGSRGPSFGTKQEPV